MAEVVRSLGLISGTSMDGIDVAVIDTDGERVAAFGPTATFAYAPNLRTRLLAMAASPGVASAADEHNAEAELTDAHAAIVNVFAKANNMDLSDIAVIGFHGQTILHRPADRLTRQFGDGARLAGALAVDVVNDFRAADVAAGGQGAPLASLYHRALAAGLQHPIAVLNVGGVSNVTYIDGDEALAFDTGPGNALLDDWIARHTGATHDEGGKHAAAGKVDAGVLAKLLNEPYFEQHPPKSLDRNDFDPAPVDSLTLTDGAATLVEFTAQSVARALPHLPAPPLRWLVCGGGRHNPVIMSRLTEVLAVPCDPVEAVGWNGDALEAQAFAFLAVRSLRGLPLSLPSTTGVPQPMRGGVLHKAPAVAA